MTNQGKRYKQQQDVGIYGLVRKNEREERQVQVAYYQNMSIANTFPTKYDLEVWADRC